MSGDTTRLIFMDATAITAETVETLINTEYATVEEEESEAANVYVSGLVTIYDSNTDSTLTLSEGAAAALLSESESESESSGTSGFTIITDPTPNPSGGFAFLPDNTPQTMTPITVVDKYMLGTPLRKWKAVWAETGVILTSDQKDKHFIQDSDLGLDFVMSLRPVSFKLRVEAQGRRHYGFVAQEVAPALKGRSFAGLVDSEAGYGVIYTELIAPLVKAVQEQQKQIDDLKAQVRKLLG